MLMFGSVSCYLTCNSGLINGTPVKPGMIPSNRNIQTNVLHLLLTVGLHDISDVDGRSLNVENLDHLLIDHSHHHRVGI